MKNYKFCIILLIFAILLNSCGKLSEGMTGSKRTKSSDEFLVHKKKPLVVPPDFDEMPSPNPEKKNEKSLSSSGTSIEDLLGMKKKQKEKINNSDDKSLEQTILKKIYDIE